MKAWRYLVGEASAAMNMAIDRAILQLAANGKSPPTLRLYTWNPPAVSLGYFQRKRGPNPEVCQRLGLDLVRRPSGGRAVLHKGDLTYAVVAGVSDGIPYDANLAYRLISKGLLIGLRSLGVSAEVCEASNGASQPAICFLRPAPGEIVYRGKKFVGNAQAWAGETLLQHGSIAVEPQIDYLTELFRPTDHPIEPFREETAAKITSIHEITGGAVTVTDVRNALILGMGQALGVTFEPGELTCEESTLARELASAPPEQLLHRTRRRISSMEPERRRRLCHFEQSEKSFTGSRK